MLLLTQVKKKRRGAWLLHAFEKNCFQCLVNAKQPARFRLAVKVIKAKRAVVELLHAYLALGLDVIRQ